MIAIAIFAIGVAVLTLNRREAAPRLAVPFDISEVGFIHSDARSSAPPIAPVEDSTAFDMWQRNLRSRLVSIFDVENAISTESSFEVTNVQHLDDGLTRTMMAFESFDGSMIPAVLQRREGSLPRAAILLISGHTKPDESGLAQLVVGESSYQHAAATKLAHAGYVTLAFELRGFGELGKLQNTDHRLVAYNALLEGEFYKKIVIADAYYALRVLMRSEGVDTNRIGVAGVSFGGELAVAFAALSENVQAVYFAGYGGRTGAFGYATGTADDQPHYCHIIPGHRRLMRREDIILLLAPRSVLGMRGEREGPVSDEFRSRTQQAWSSSGAPDNYSFEVAKGGGHEFFVSRSIAFFDDAFKPVLSTH